MNIRNDRSKEQQRFDCGLIKKCLVAIVTFLPMSTFGGIVWSDAGSTDDRVVQLRDGIRAVHIGFNAKTIDLAEAAFYCRFDRDLVSKHGMQRTHAVVKAILVPRNAQGGLDLSAGREEASIDRSATMDRLVFPDLGELTFSPDGIISGQLRNGSKEKWDYGAFLILTAVVFDQIAEKIPDSGLIDELSLPQFRLNPKTQATEAGQVVACPLFFYKEWSPDRRTWPKAEEGQSVVAHFAVRRQFSLLLRPKSFPYDPEEHPLRAYCPASIDGAANALMTMAITVVGGIEPYEARITGLPQDLKWDAENMIISGTPAGVGHYDVKIEVKDSQFSAGNWQQAIDAKETLGKPYHKLNTTFVVRKPLEVQLFLPPFSRKGTMASAYCLCKGGYGRPKFTAVELPNGIQVDPESGLIEGIPTEVGQHDIVISVRSPGLGPQGQTSTARGTWRIIESRPEPTIR